MDNEQAAGLQVLDEGLLGKSYKHLKENQNRRARWAFMTEGKVKRSRHDRNPFISAEHGLPASERRKLEVLMDNMIGWSHSNEARLAGESAVTRETMAVLRGDAKENAVTTANITPFTTTVFPLIRRVFPNLISNFLVAIQPIPQPTALLYFLDFKVGTNFAPAARGDRLDDRTLVSGRTRMHRLRQYSRGIITGEAVGTGTGSAADYYLAYFPLKTGSVTVYVNGVATAVTGLDLETGKFNLNAAGGAAITADYTLTFEGTGPIPEVELDITTDSVSAAVPRKLKSRFSIEAQMDSMAYHGIDIDSELLTVMAEEITREIDGEIIEDLLTAAASGAGNVNWSTTVGSGYSPIEWQRTFLEAFLDASQLIHAKRLRYANWIVAGDDIIVRLQKMAGFNPNIGQTPGGGVAGTFDSFNTPVVNGQGPAFIGTLQNKYAIFHDPVHLPATKALVGYRGQSMIDTGYVYAPYMPFYVTPSFTDPNDFSTRRGLMSRYATKLISGEFYSTVTVT